MVRSIWSEKATFDCQKFNLKLVNNLKVTKESQIRNLKEEMTHQDELVEKLQVKKEKEEKLIKVDEILIVARTQCNDQWRRIIVIIIINHHNRMMITAGKARCWRRTSED